jgi:hypothetical protein
MVSVGIDLPAHCHSRSSGPRSGSTPCATRHLPCRCWQLCCSGSRRSRPLICPVSTPRIVQARPPQPMMAMMMARESRPFRRRRNARTSARAAASAAPPCRSASRAGRAFSRRKKTSSALPAVLRQATIARIQRPVRSSALPVARARPARSCVAGRSLPAAGAQPAWRRLSLRATYLMSASNT